MHFARIAAAFIAGALASAAFAQAGPSSEELGMAARSPAYRVAADRFIAAAVAGDAATLERMLDPAMVARAGKETLVKVLAGQVVPFFAEHQETARSVATTNTTDGSGNQGFAYSMFSVAHSGPQKPYVIYVVDEGGQKTVANIPVNQLVQGRHP